MVKLLHQYLPENGIEIIDHTHIEQARYQMKETYKWGGKEDLVFSISSSVVNIFHHSNFSSIL